MLILVHTPPVQKNLILVREPLAAEVTPIPPRVVTPEEVTNVIDAVPEHQGTAVAHHAAAVAARRRYF